MWQKKVEQALEIRNENRKGFKKNLTQAIQCEWCFKSQPSWRHYLIHVRSCTAKHQFAKYTDTTDLEIQYHGKYSYDDDNQPQSFNDWQNDESLKGVDTDDQLNEINTPRASFQDDAAHQQHLLWENLMLQNYADNTVEGRKKQKEQAQQQNVMSVDDVDDYPKSIEDAMNKIQECIIPYQEVPGLAPMIRNSMQMCMCFFL